MGKAVGKPIRTLLSESRIALLILILLLHCTSVSAEVFTLPLEPLDTVVGEIGVAVAKQEDTLVDIARRYDLGYEEIILANPQVDRWIPGEGTRVVLPSSYILPDTPREGIVLNLAELRLYYFAPKEPGVFPRVYTYPVSIGRMDWKSPLGKTRVVAKEKDPAWYPTNSIRLEHAAEGDQLEKIIPGGAPNNPLGHFALRLALPQYLIHGTDEQHDYGIGMRVTHGCIRMYPEDIEEVFQFVEINTPVTFVDQPIKVGWRGSDLFLEIHVPLPEDESEFEEYSHKVANGDVAAQLTEKAMSSVRIIPGRINQTLRHANGLPTIVGHTSSRLPPAR